MVFFFYYYLKVLFGLTRVGESRAQRAACSRRLETVGRSGDARAVTIIIIVLVVAAVIIALIVVGLLVSVVTRARPHGRGPRRGEV